MKFIPGAFAAPPQIPLRFPAGAFFLELAQASLAIGGGGGFFRPNPEMSSFSAAGASEQ